MTASFLAVSEEVRETLASGGAVVALETTLVAHGFPGREGVEVALESERRVRAAGAVPATVGVLDGVVRVGLGPEELARFDGSARKAGPRDLAACAVRGEVGATTVGGTLVACAAAGIRFVGTGGLGGVHRGWPGEVDVSPDLATLARTPALVVSSGVKSLLDVPTTAELLEALGVPVLGYRTDELPLFYEARGGPAVSQRVGSPAEAAAVSAAHWELSGGGLLLGNPPAEPIEDVEPLLARAVAAATADRISGQAVTPFVLAYLHRESEGRTLAANARLIADNAALAAEVAVAAAGGRPPRP